MENPFSKGKIPFFILVDNNEIQGTIGAMLFQFSHNKKTLLAGHLVNFFINPKYKGLHALRLFLTIINEYDIVFGSYVSNDAYKLCKSAKFIDHSADLYNYYLPVPIEQLDSTTSRPVKRLVINTGRSIFLSTVALITRSFAALKNYHCDIKTSFDHNFISLIEEKEGKEFGFIKNVTFLLWRYNSCPTLNPIYFQLNISNVPSICLIAHYDHQSNTLAIMDVICDEIRSCDLIILILQALFYCKQNNIKGISNTCTDKRFGAILKFLSFSSVVSDYHFLSFTRIKDLKKISKITDNWKFMLGDTDVY